MTIQSVILGNIGRDAELRQAGSASVCNFSLAASRKYKGEETTTWVRVALWGQSGEKLCQYLTKGKRVQVVGEMWQHEHDGKFYLECRAHTVTFLDRSEGAGDRQRGTSPAYEKHEQKATGKPASDNYDDAPF